MELEEMSDNAHGSSRNDSYTRAENPSRFNPDLHNEARKLLQILQDKDNNIEDKDENIQQYEEEMDNLRKNIIHLQTEYELLDHKYRAELCYREEIERRREKLLNFLQNEATRKLIDTVQDYAEILASSIKMLDDDKFKITDFYNEIHRRQEITEAKRKKLEVTVKELDELINNRVAQVTEDRDQLLKKIQELTTKKTDVKEKLMNEINHKNELERKIEELRGKINEMTAEVNTSKVNESNLRNKLMIQKVKGGKIQKMMENTYKKKIRLLNFKNKSLRENLSASEEKISVLKEDLEMKYLEIQKELQKIYDDSSNEVKNLEEKLNLSMSENENFKNTSKKLEMDLENINIENNKLKKEEFEHLRQQLLDQENKLERKTEENLMMKKRIEELNTETQNQAHMITYFQVKNQNDEELNRKINDLEVKVQMYCKSEAELQGRIALQNEKLCSQRSGYEMLVSEQKSHISILEEDMERIKLENKNTKYQLDESISKYNDLKNEFQKKSAEIEKLKSKIIEMSNEKAILESSKTNQSVTGGTSEKITSIVQSTSRKLLSTPVRLLQSPALSPTMKKRTPIMKKRDPYNFDSDSSFESLQSDKASKNIKTGPKRGNSSSKRGK